MAPSFEVGQEVELRINGVFQVITNVRRILSGGRPQISVRLSFARTITFDALGRCPRTDNFFQIRAA